MTRHWNRSLKAFQIYGANTDVGKTIASTVFCRAAYRLKNHQVHYLKPVATGPAETIDILHVKKHMPDDWHNFRCFQHLQAPLSPPLALRLEHLGSPELRGTAKSDSMTIRSKLIQTLKSTGASPDKPWHTVAIVETFGGPMSPMAHGEPQADYFRSLRLPVILVADTRLGGVSTTISAYESLTIRGYDIHAILYIQNEPHENRAEIQRYLAQQYTLDSDISHLHLPSVPPPQGDPKVDFQNMSQYYKEVDQNRRLQRLLRKVMCDEKYSEQLSTMSSRAAKSIWHPFMQHKDRQAQDILAIDSAYRDWFEIYIPSSTKSSGNDEYGPELPLTKRTIDGSASWWTQGLGHGNPQLALAAAYAAGRYGHVMFAGAVHKPAIDLAERILEGLKNPRLAKVFFSDDGSTGVEVAIKMALKASSKRYDWTEKEELGIIGLQGSYHGDTIGAMDCSEPSTYNQKVEWYRGRGFWFDFPQVSMKKGKWVIESPTGKEDELGAPQTFESLQEIFSLDRDPQKYENYIDSVLEKEIVQKKRKFGALLLEPVLLGAGGMIFADPLFQRALVAVVRRRQFGTVVEPEAQGQTKANTTDLAWTGLPVVFDEVFTGLYRLGSYSAAQMLEVHPDISIHAKLLTGGILPLCLTVASNSIFEAFLGNEKSDALLHGHSYTAHAIGCHVANESLEMMDRMYAPSAKPNATIKARKETWKSTKQSTGTPIWSMWPRGFVERLSHANGVDGIVALGTVLAIKLSDPSGSGYTSNAAQGIQEKLLEGTDEQLAIHCRVLGNVLYLMTSLTTSKPDLVACQMTLSRVFGLDWSFFEAALDQRTKKDQASQDTKGFEGSE